MKLLLLFLCISSVFTSPTEKITSIRKNIGGRIIGGTTAYSGQFPFAAAVTKTTTEGNFFCGGTLITNQYVLTAGQCVVGATLFVVHLGSNYLNASDPYMVHASADVYMYHPQYDPNTLNNDIGLIWLREPVEFSDYLKTIQFLAYGDLQAGNQAMAIGWGQIADDQPGIVEELRFVYVTVLSNDECKIVYGNQILDNMVCVEGNYNEGTCIGDSGGALVQMIGHGYPMIVAISSFVSQNGCESTDPSGFTRLYSYIDWIQSITGRGS